MTQESDIEISSGNVFADLEMSNPEERLVKAELARKISEAIENCSLTQDETAQLLGIDRPKVSALIRGKLAGFSTERLLNFLIALGNDVEISIKPKPESRSKAQISVIR
ncbi:helix-turn-helix domain-containing protein [Scytonema sp. NUACC26]|uniref:helix-turn-helix domain-containing protein n=1 Tax=Scytonema sp. NUACC26 TaxID=3140176 RepID=UPI0034DCC478